MSTRITLRKTSLIDYPGRISALVFFLGCNLRCPWCHNSGLVLGNAEDTLKAEEGLAFIQKRRGILGGAVLSGGEPCLWEGLPDYIREIKHMNIPVKLDTNGMFPAMIEKLIEREETRPDYIALDLKLAPERYTRLLSASAETTAARNNFFPDEARQNDEGPQGIFNPGEALRLSAALISESGIAHEYRTLALPAAFIGKGDIEALAPLVDPSPWYFRLFRGGNCLDPAWDELEERAEEARARADSLADTAKALGKNALSG